MLFNCRKSVQNRHESRLVELDGVEVRIANDRVPKHFGLELLELIIEPWKLRLAVLEAPVEALQIGIGDFEVQNRHMIEEVEPENVPLCQRKRRGTLGQRSRRTHR